MSKVRLALNGVEFSWNLDKDDGTFAGGVAQLKPQHLTGTLLYMLALACLDGLKTAGLVPMNVAEVQVKEVPTDG